MSKYVPDISTHRWVIVSPQRLSRPEGFKESDKSRPKICPFCEGNELMTPPEVMRIGAGEANKPGWKIRVVPNKFPITDIHEVIIHSPNHEKDIENLPLPYIESILRVYRERFNFLKKKGQVLIFNNHGEHAGASLPHPHTQLVVIPSQINLDTLAREPLANIVEETKFFNVYCPDFSQWPYEVWIAQKNIPTGGESVFGDIQDAEISDLANILKQILNRLNNIYNKQKFTNLPFGYNFYIYHKENWYLRIIPRFINRAGFELGTGLYVNIIDPLQAIVELRGVEKKMKRVMEKLKKY